MSNDTDFQQALETIIKGIVKGAICFEGTIQKVNTDYTYDVTVSKTIYHNVPVDVLKGKRASLYLQPKVGTNCNLTFRDGNIQRPIITKIHEADKLLIDVPETVFNSGTHGMVKADELKSQSEKDKDILDALLQIINGSPIPEPGNGSASAFQTALKAALTGKQSGTWNDLENSKIKQ